MGKEKSNKTNRRKRKGGKAGTLKGRLHLRGVSRRGGEDNGRKKEMVNAIRTRRLWKGKNNGG